MKIYKPQPSQASYYYQNYLDTAPGEYVLESLSLTKQASIDVLKNIPASLEDYRYAPKKWTIKQLWQHIIDCEQVFSYRLLRILRGDQTALVGFDENAFAANDASDLLSLDQLKADFLLVREHTFMLLKQLKVEQLDLELEASDCPFSPRILLWIISGHNQHHLNILKERYL